MLNNSSLFIIHNKSNNKIFLKKKKKKTKPVQKPVQKLLKTPFTCQKPVQNYKKQNSGLKKYI